MRGMTKRQKEILNFLESYIKEHKYPPAVRDIALHFGISSKASYDHLRALKKKQVIRSSSSQSRSIEILQPGNQEEETVSVKIPILGSVAAGRPLLAEENLDGYMEVPASFVHKGEYFFLHVKGDSMVDAGILNGDLALIRQQSTAENGEIVVALLDEAVTIKRLYVEKNRVRLQPANPAVPAIYTKSLKILGKLVYLIRDYGK